MQLSSKFRTFFAVLFLIVISLWSVWRVAERPKDVVTDKIDGVLIVWILNQTISKVPDNLENIFQGNIFYPHKNTMAYSELFVPSAIISYIPTRLSGEPVVATSSTIIFGQIMVLLIVFLFFYEITKSKLAALLGATVLGLSGIRMHYFGHLQMWNMQWWILSVWMLWRFFKNKKAWQIYVAAVFVAVQAWESILPVYFIMLASGLLVWQNKMTFIKHFKHFLLAGIAVSFLIMPVVITYLGVSTEFEYTRSIRDAAHFALSFDQLGDLFFSPVLFFLFGLSLILSSFAKKINRNNLKWFWLVLIFSFVLSLGPVLKWQNQTIKLFNKIFIPLPYGVLYYVVPGFKALRTPSRWIIVSTFSMSGIVALTFSNLRFYKKQTLIVIAIALAIIGGSKIPSVHDFPRMSNYPQVYEWLKDQKDEVIIELPIYSWAAGEKVGVETKRMVYSIYHGKKLVNGYSGFTPPEWMDLVSGLSGDFPSKDLEAKLKLRNISLIVVNRGEYSLSKLKEIDEWGKEKLVWEDASFSVFKL